MATVDKQLQRKGRFLREAYVLAYRDRRNADRRVPVRSAGGCDGLGDEMTTDKMKAWDLIEMALRDSRTMIKVMARANDGIAQAGIERNEQALVALQQLRPGDGAEIPGELNWTREINRILCRAYETNNINSAQLHELAAAFDPTQPEHYQIGRPNFYPWHKKENKNG